MSILDVDTAAVNLSSLAESVISGEMAAATAAGAGPITGTVPMAAATDPAEFAAALNAAGAAYLGAAAQHVGQRVAFAGAQNLASIGYLLNELLNAAALTV
jgi:hypothetical protein